MLVQQLGFQVKLDIKLFFQYNTMIQNETATSNPVRDEEISWMLSKRPLVHSKSQLVIDYGDEAKEMIGTYTRMK